MLTCRRDIDRMRQPAGVLSSEEIARLKHQAEAELEGQRAVAQARKEKMIKVCTRKTRPVTPSSKFLAQLDIACLSSLQVWHCLHCYLHSTGTPRQDCTFWRQVIRGQVLLLGCPGDLKKQGIDFA